MSFEIVSKTIGTLAVKYGKVAAKAKKYLPEILLVAGCGSVGIGTVLACKATLDTQTVSDNMKNQLGQIEDEDPEKGRKKTEIMLSAAGKYASAYAPAASCIIGGMAAIGASHGVLRQRLAGVCAYSVALETMYKNYRQRVISEHGEETDKKYRLGIYDEKIIEKKQLKNGKEKEVTTVIETVHSDGFPYSPYSRYFDAYNTNRWSKSQGENWDFLRIAQSMSNEKFDRQGYLFLNDVYELLGFDKVPEGQLVGWVKGLGDDFIDFGLFEARNADARDYVNHGSESIFVLDFNCDGLMWDLI